VTVNPYRLIAATTSIVTALVIQASVLSALSAPLAVSLPAVLVAVVGTQAGASAGMSMGFSAGLLADLSSRHPAGVLALCWLALGLGCGLLSAPRRRLRWMLLAVAVACALTALVATSALAVLGSVSADLGTALVRTPLTALVDAALAFLIIWPTRAVLRAHGSPDPVRRIERVRWARTAAARLHLTATAGAVADG
jgi:cell shape-determining protein MreD